MKTKNTPRTPEISDKTGVLERFDYLSNSSQSDLSEIIYLAPDHVNASTSPITNLVNVSNSTSDNLVNTSTSPLDNLVESGISPLDNLVDVSSSPLDNLIKTYVETGTLTDAINYSEGEVTAIVRNYIERSSLNFDTTARIITDNDISIILQNYINTVTPNPVADVVTDTLISATVHFDT